MADECGGPSTTSGCIYNSVVGPSYSPARRPPKKSLGRTRAERRKGDRITRGAADCRLRVFSTRCTVARYASLLVLHNRLNRILVEVHPRYYRDIFPEIIRRNENIVQDVILTGNDDSLR